MLITRVIGHYDDVMYPEKTKSLTNIITQLFLTLKLKDRIRDLVQLCFIKRNGQRRYKYIVTGRDIA